MTEPRIKEGRSSTRPFLFNEKCLLPYKPYNHNKQNRHSNDKDINPRGLQCFECKGYGHKVVDCANNEYKGSKNKNFVGTWDAYSDDEPVDCDNSDNIISFTVFPATIDFDDVQHDKSYLPNPLNEDINDVETANDFSREEMVEDIESLIKLTEKLLSQNSSLKGIVEHLESENKRLNDQVLSFEKDLKNTNDIISKFNKSSHDLDIAVSLGKRPLDKSGLESPSISGKDRGSPLKSTTDELTNPLDKLKLENHFVPSEDKVLPRSLESTSDSTFMPSSSRGLLPTPKGTIPKKTAFRSFPASKIIPNDSTFGRKIPLGLPRNHRRFECSYCKKVGHTVDYCYALKETNLANELRKLRALKDRNRSTSLKNGSARNKSSTKTDWRPKGQTYTDSKRGPAKRKSKTRAEWRPIGKKKDVSPRVQTHPRQGTNRYHGLEGIWFKTREDMDFYLDEYFDRRERAHGARYY